MNLRYIENGNKNIWEDKKKNKWKYIDKNSFQKENNGKSYFFGDVGKKGQNSDYILKDDNQEVSVYKYRQKVSFFEKIEGYIYCKEEATSDYGYIRIIKYSWEKISAILLICLALLIGGFFFLKNNNGPVLDKAAIAYEMPGGIVNEDPESISLPGYSIITYRLSEGKVNIPLINPKGNLCYFCYNIYLKDTGELLYRSGYIKPGTAIVEYEFNKNLEKGSYDIIINVEAVDIDDHTIPLNSGEMEAVLEVVD